MNNLEIPVEAKISLNRFVPRWYQLPLLDAIENKGYRKVVAILPRRAGKDVAAWNLMIRQALQRVGIYWYILPTYAQGKKVIWDGMIHDGMRFMDFIPKELTASSNSQEMKIKLINGSLIQIIGSDNVDSLVGSNPVGCVFSEYALQDPRAYQYIRPILTANGGWAVFISCVSPNTLVLSEKGLRRIKNISSSREEFTPLNEKMYGLGGFHNAEDFYYGGVCPTLKIKLASGFEIECTPIHPLWNGRDWIKSQYLKVGDLLPIQYGQDIWGNGLDISSFERKEHGLENKVPFEYESDNFFYFLGIMHADGCYDYNNITITNSDCEIQSFLLDHSFKTHDDLHFKLSSRRLCALLEFLEFRHGAKNKSFPEKLLSCTKQQMKCFFQGIFDGDGTSNSCPDKRGAIKYVTTNYDFAKTIQIVLLNFGIVSSLRKDEREPGGIVATRKNCKKSISYSVEICGYFAHIFYSEIGFRVKRKQSNYRYISSAIKKESGNIYPIDLSRISDYCLPKNLISNAHKISRRLIARLNERRPHPYLTELLREKFFYSPIVSIEQSQNEVFDFVIPDTHSFLSNGFISHNTVRGKNHLYELYNIAKESDSWFCYKLTLDDTLHIPLSEIEKERADGIMSDDLIQQEYYNSFEMGIEGSYYAKYIDRMRINRQIGDVPLETGFKVNTCWDIGVRDSTSIIFFQNVGATVRIIDFYENSKEGLEHYVKVLESKNYNYGKHIAPHDIAVKEFGSGMTRIEKAKELGIKFTIANNVSIMDGIETVRSSFSKIWIDEKKCARLIKALENYRQEYDSKRRVYRSNPLHDQWSHAADAMRYMCVSLAKTRDGLSAEELDKRYLKALYGEKATMPAVFRDDLPPY